MPHLQKNVHQCITRKTTEMVDTGNTRKAKTTRVSQHRMPDYKNVLYVSFLVYNNHNYYYTTQTSVKCIMFAIKQNQNWM